MKKLIYFILFLVITSATITSCIEEEVKPQTEANGGGAPLKE